ncbi:MAG: PLP-dependent aminotransferase family protein, partial [Xanthomonadales bacterium]|nr:PLP-dependent aminotransferase family protein [Xanthomonadales bacterium]
ATFDTRPPEGTINLGIGQPSPDLMPVELFRELSEQFLARAKPLDFNYGEKQGDIRFRESLADFLSIHYGADAGPDELFLTGGNSQALDLACARFSGPGDTIFVEEPAYFLAYQVFRDHDLDIRPLPTDKDGLSIDALESLLERVQPELLYTIPSFSNPGGQMMSGPRRERLVELSREHDFIILADEVYQLLPCFGDVPLALGTMIRQGNVLSLGSFSKILAPGLRLGWIQGSEHLVSRILDFGWINSGGSINHVSSHLVRHAIDSGLQDQHLEFVKDAYRERLLAMHSALEQHLADMARWTRPDGGYFFWIELPEGTDALALRGKAANYQTGFQPGPLFSAQGGFGNWLRLSFAHYGVADIEKGIERLARLLRESGSAS